MTELVGAGADSAAILVDHRRPDEAFNVVQEALQNPSLIKKKRLLSRERAMTFARSSAVDELSTALLSL